MSEERNYTQVLSQIWNDLPDNEELIKIAGKKGKVTVKDDISDVWAIVDIDLRLLLTKAIAQELVSKNALGDEYYKSVNPSMERITVECKGKNLTVKIERTQDAINAYNESQVGHPSDD